MHPRRRESHTHGASRATISRRTLLAAGGIVAFSGLSGCLGRVASTVTNTGASPAAVFAGGGGGGRVALTEPRVTRLTPTFSAEVRGVSGEVELEGWVTSSSLVVATDDNSSRSNTESTVADSDSDGDGLGDGTARTNYNNTRSNRSSLRPAAIVGDDLDESDETFRVVSRLDGRLREATAAAWAAISKRSARTGRAPDADEQVSAALGEMDAALMEFRAELERCSRESCVAALENVAHREADVRRARTHIANQEWSAFGLGGGESNDILVGDYFLPPATFDPSGSYDAGEQAALFRYLEGQAVVAERFTVAVPDAEVPGGEGSIEEVVTPQRLIEYVTGQSDGSSRVYSWGDADSDGDGIGDCDDGDGAIFPGAVCGDSDHLSAAISGPVATGGTLEAVRASDGTVLILNTPPTAERGASVLVCPAEGEAYEPANLRSWGARAASPPMEIAQQGRLLDVTVAQVRVQLPGCPHPFPALFYVGRAGSDGQLIYSGGWVIDDAALYEDATTMLTMRGAAPIVGIDPGDLDSDGDGLADAVERAARRSRAYVRYSGGGARLDTDSVGALDEAEVLSEDVRTAYDDWYVRKKPGRSAETSGDSVVTHLALDAFVLHLVNAGDASNEVKFKAGAELSTSVN